MTATLDAPAAATAPARRTPEADPMWITAEMVAAMTFEVPKVEIWHGELKIKMASRPSKLHGEVQAECTRLLGNFIKPRALGRLFNESGVLLRRDPDVLYGPDVAFYATGRGDGHPTFFAGGPDLVVEVVSPNNTRRDVETKVDLYQRYGTRLIWVIELVPPRVTVHRLNEGPTLMSGNEVLDGGDVLPGMKVKVDELFA